LLLGGLWLLTGCGGLRLHLENAAVQKPGNVALYFSVESANKDPIGGLTADVFRIYEDGELISPFESKQTILNPELAVIHHTLLLLDLSGSVIESGSLPTLLDAAGQFADRVSQYHRVSIYGFDGRSELIPVLEPTSQAGSVKASLARLASFKPKDPSTNLNGAIVEATKVLDGQLSHAKQPLRFATLVVFTDGTDRAHRVADRDMKRALEDLGASVFVIGVGAEISVDKLEAIGREGFIKADQITSVGGAFDAVAARIEAASRKYYLLSYCSPSRAGTHKLRVEVTNAGDSGALSHGFDAEGFGAGCDPTRSPNFPVIPKTPGAEKEKKSSK
jgi:hypothetical protein